MADKMCENNQVTIMGEIVSDFSYSHEVYGEGFYMVEVSVHRLSERRALYRHASAAPRPLPDERLLPSHRALQAASIPGRGRRRDRLLRPVRGEKVGGGNAPGPSRRRPDV